MHDFKFCIEIRKIFAIFLHCLQTFSPENKNEYQRLNTIRHFQRQTRKNSWKMISGFKLLSSQKKKIAWKKGKHCSKKKFVNRLFASPKGRQNTCWICCINEINRDTRHTAGMYHAFMGSPKNRTRQARKQEGGSRFKTGKQEDRLHPSKPVQIGLVVENLWTEAVEGREADMTGHLHACKYTKTNERSILLMYRPVNPKEESSTNFVATILFGDPKKNFYYLHAKSFILVLNFQNMQIWINILF